MFKNAEIIIVFWVTWRRVVCYRCVPTFRKKCLPTFRKNAHRHFEEMRADVSGKWLPTFEKMRNDVSRKMRAEVSGKCVATLRGKCVPKFRRISYRNFEKKLCVDVSKINPAFFVVTVSESAMPQIDVQPLPDVLPPFYVQPKLRPNFS